jgi:predicted O-methyltransferase YrrM
MNRQLLLKELRQYWKLNEVPNITEVNASFLKKLIKINKTQNMLEIWSANGLSAIEFWITLEETGWKLKTIEFSANSHNQAVENIKKASLEKTVEAVLWNALEIIPWLQEKYDFVFIDGMKRRSKDFLELVWDKVDNNWVIVIDDVIKFREKMIWLYEYLEEKNIDFTVIPVDIDDWVMIIVR